MSLRILVYTRPGEARDIEAAIGTLPGIHLRCADSAAAFGEELAVAEVAILPMYLYDGATAQALRTAPRLRWIQSMSVGVDRLQTDPPSPEVTVTTAGDAMAGAIGDHAMALLLALARQLPGFVSGQAASRWDASPRTRIESLHGKTLAIVGFGAIGRELARRARPFGMHVVGLRRTPGPDPDVDEMLHIDALDAALARADAVVITAPLSLQTRGMFNPARLARMRRGAWLVNVSRGAIVDTQALVGSLVTGHLGGAALDVTEPEPPGPEHPLWRTPNLLLTPHVAAAGSNPQVAAFIAANVQRFMSGVPLLAVHQPGMN